MQRELRLFKVPRFGYHWNDVNGNLHGRREKSRAKLGREWIIVSSDCWSPQCIPFLWFSLKNSHEKPEILRNWKTFRITAPQFNWGVLQKLKVHCFKEMLLEQLWSGEHFQYSLGQIIVFIFPPLSMCVRVAIIPVGIHLINRYAWWESEYIKPKANNRTTLTYNFLWNVGCCFMDFVTGKCFP